MLELYELFRSHCAVIAFAEVSGQRSEEIE